MNIKVTNHSIEEYLNDNPKEKNPKVKLLMLYKKMSIERRNGWNIKRFYNKNTWINKIILKNQVIILSNFTIITYYKFLTEIVLDEINKIKVNIIAILNWNIKEHKTKASLKRIKQKKKKEVRKFYKYSKHKFRFL